MNEIILLLQPEIILKNNRGNLTLTHNCTFIRDGQISWLLTVDQSSLTVWLEEQTLKLESH